MIAVEVFLLIAAVAVATTMGLIVLVGRQSDERGQRQ